MARYGTPALGLARNSSHRHHEKDVTSMAAGLGGYVNKYGSERDVHFLSSSPSSVIIIIIGDLGDITGVKYEKSAYVALHSIKVH